MKKTVVVHQPDFLPYLGFFHRFVNADLYVALDHVQFVQHTAGAWTHRDKIKTRNGAAWISQSVKKCPINTAIVDVELSSEGAWRQSNLNMIKENYRRAPFFDLVFGPIEEVYGMPISDMVSFNLKMIDLICAWLRIDIVRVQSSALTHHGSKSEMVAGLVEVVGGTCYLSGQGARAYHQQDAFERRTIEVKWQDFKHPVYPQQFGAFLPGLSVIDALFNCGPDQTRDMLRAA